MKTPNRAWLIFDVGKMRIAAVFFLLSALVSGAYGLKLSRTAAIQHWREYEAEAAFVTKLKKEGLDPQELEKRVFDVHVRRKGAALDFFPLRTCQQISMISTGIALVLILAGLVTKIDKPNQPPQPTATSVTPRADSSSSK